MTRFFGTDGIRGVANVDLTAELAFKLGQAGASVLTKGRGGVFVIGKDTRISGDMFEAALAAGICSVGSQALKVSVLPTPAIAYLTKALRADGGVVISASHNPAEYNGIKFFGPDGFKLADSIEDEIEAAMVGYMDLPTGPSIGTVKSSKYATDLYIDHVVNTIAGNLEGLKVAIDCGHGAAYQVSPAVFRQLGAEVMAVNTSPNGTNINLGCGSTHTEYIQEIVTSHDVDVGFAHDGDADRVIAVDEAGETVDGDFMLAICAVHLKKQGRLPKDSLVTTVMANLGFDLAMKKHGIGIAKTKVGDRYVLEEMLKKDVAVGGEQSGHIIFLDYNTTGDGIITALQLASIMMQTGSKLSELRRVMEKMPQVLVNVKAKGINGWQEVPSIKESIREAEEELGSRGRILVRQSGTEPLIRVMVESDSFDSANFIAHRVAGVIGKCFVEAGGNK
ncbi:MAG: phosphoglucosamine mutase [Actinobacteria bacterium]|nr:phosphoglucosamine mutase [Actinomycetota bacterium]